MGGGGGSTSVACRRRKFCCIFLRFAPGNPQIPDHRSPKLTDSGVDRILLWGGGGLNFDGAPQAKFFFAYFKDFSPEDPTTQITGAGNDIYS